MRMFIALRLPEAMNAAVSRKAKSLAAEIEGTFVRPGNLHVTLAFLGEVGEADELAVIESLRAACRNVQPFELSTGQFGVFGREAPGHRILWMGFAKNPILETLADGVRRELEKRGIAFDQKPFRAHVTLARRASLTNDGLAQLNERSIEATGTVDTIELFASTLASTGAVYESRARIRLGGDTR